MNWFYESGGQQHGPVNDGELERLLGEGRLHAETLVWREGMTDWQPLRTARPAAPAGGGPGTARCASCGQFFPEEDLALIGSRTICPECKPAVLLALQQGSLLPDAGEGDRTGPPWEHRETLGFFPALWQTITQVITSPSSTFSLMRREGGIGRPFLFFYLISTVATVFANVAFGLFLSATGYHPSTAGLPTWQAQYLLAVTTPETSYRSAMLAPLSAALMPFISAGIWHLCLMMCGGARRPFETTFRVLCYSAGAVAVLNFIPVCGGLAGGLWNIVVLCIGFSRAHEISGGRATIAVLLPLLLCCVFSVVLGVVMGALVAAATTAGHH